MVTDADNVKEVKGDNARPDDRSERGVFGAFNDIVRPVERSAEELFQQFEKDNHDLLARVGSLLNNPEIGHHVKEMIDYFADKGEPLYQLLRGEK